MKQYPDLSGRDCVLRIAIDELNFRPYTGVTYSKWEGSRRERPSGNYALGKANPNLRWFNPPRIVDQKDLGLGASGIVEPDSKDRNGISGGFRYARDDPFFFFPFGGKNL